jgi:dephospho-CoA kinase
VLVIGITGRNCAGKDSAAKALRDRGFESHSLSDVLRVELRARGEPITRPALIAVGNELRKAEGPAVLARRVQSLMAGDRVALVSVRSPAEVACLRELPRFVLVGLEAPAAVRFARERERARESAPATLAEFEALEARENTRDPNAQQLDATMREADYRVANEGTLDELETRIGALLEAIDDRPQ